MLPSTNRRRFLQSACASTAMSVCLGGRTEAAEQATADQESQRRYAMSLKWGMIDHQGSTLDRFKLLKEIGFDGVELDSPDGVDKQEAIAASQATGLPIEGIVNSTHWRVRHSDPDPGVRAQALKNMQTALRDAKAVGADSVLLVPGKVTDPERENHDQVWERSIAEIRKLLPLAESLEVMILIENVGNGFCPDPTPFARYIDEIDSPWVAVHFDIGNHISVSPPAEWIRVLGPRIKKVDVKDRTREQERRKIGEGDADWPAVREALREIDYRGWAAAEVPGGDRERLAEILQRMHRVLHG